jgi:putative DNA primase/helicase
MGDVMTLNLKLGPSMELARRRTRVQFDLDAIRQALPARAAEIAITLLGEPNPRMSSRKELRFGRKGSVAVAIAGPKAGQWYDHETGVGGDTFDLIRYTRGYDFIGALRYVQDFIGSMPVCPAPARPSAAAPAEDSSRNRDRALRLWAEAQPIACTPAAGYLARRKILDIASTIDGTVLRFHPRCPFGENTRLPCMVALLRDVQTDEPKAIMRTAVTAFGEKVGRKVLGPKTGAAVKIAPANGTLAVGEGLETVLSAMMRGYAPAWALGDAGGVARFPVLAGIKHHLTIIVDNDAAGQAAALKCSRRWTAAGCEVRRVVPKPVGADFNDLVKGK